MPRSRLHAKILGQSILKRTHCRFTRLPWTVPIRNADVERRTVTMPSLFQKGFTLGHPKSQTVSSRSPRGSDLLCGNVRHLSTLCVDSLWHRRGPNISLHGIKMELVGLLQLHPVVLSLLQPVERSNDERYEHARPGQGDEGQQHLQSRRTSRNCAFQKSTTMSTTMDNNDYCSSVDKSHK